MPVRIRLRRMGRKKQPHYRVVVADSQSPRDGRFVETLGYYKPLTDPARLVLDLGRVDHWLSQGAEPSGTVRSLITKARQGGTSSVAFGVEDAEDIKTKRAEALAAKRVAEKKAAGEAVAAEAAAKAAAEAVAAEAAAAEAAAAEAAAAEAETTADAPEGEAAEDGAAGSTDEAEEKSE